MAQTRFEQDVHMVQAPDNWPQWPFLPMKRYVDGRMTCTLLMEEARPPYRLYEVNLWATSAEAFRTCKKYEYPTPEAMMQDGWTVD